MSVSFFEVQTANGETRVVIRRSLDINTAPELAEEIDKIVAAKPSKVIVDVSGLDLIDSSGIGALVKLYRGLRKDGGKMTLWGLRDQPLAIIKLVRMDSVFDITM